MLMLRVGCGVEWGGAHLQTMLMLRAGWGRVGCDVNVHLHLQTMFMLGGRRGWAGSSSAAKPQKANQNEPKSCACHMKSMSTQPDNLAEPHKTQGPVHTRQHNVRLTLRSFQGR